MNYITKGIIGGAGVKASIEVLNRIEQEVIEMGAIRDHQHPDVLMWQATKTPSRSMYLEGKGPSFIPDYIDIINKMNNAGCSKIYMCCNTAHYAIDQLLESTNVEIFNLLDESLKKISLMNSISKVGVLCSTGTAEFKLFDKYNSYGLELIYPDKEYQEIVTKGICSVKDRSEMKLPEQYLKEAINHLQSKDIDIILLGCTDLGLAINKSNMNFKFLDTIDIIVEDILKDWSF